MRLEPHPTDAFSGNPIRALLLDDSTYDRNRIRRLSTKSDLVIDIDEVPSIPAMTDMISREPFDLIMVDYHLADGDGLEALAAIHEQPLNRNAAIIMISGDEQSKTAVSAFRQGCHDFVAKRDLSAGVLQQSVSTAMERSRARNLNDANLENMLKAQVELALRRALEGGIVQSAISDGMYAAAKSVGLELGIKDAQNLLSYSDVDNFIFSI